MSAEGRLYIADSVGCRVRRISRADQVAVPITCDRRMVDEVRPSGCTMYDQPTDGIDLKVGRVVLKYVTHTLIALVSHELVGSPELSCGQQHLLQLRRDVPRVRNFQEAGCKGTARQHRCNDIVMRVGGVQGEW